MSKNKFFTGIKIFFNNFFQAKIVGKNIFKHGKFGEKIFLEKVKFFINILIFALFILILWNPSFGISEQDKKNISYEIVFGLDNSLSMLSLDGKEKGRFDRAKDKILEIVNGINGEFGLLKFAGNSYVSIPFTFDKNSFSIILKKIDIEKGARKGTDFASIKENLNKIFNLKKDKDKILILLSDGENLEGDFVDLEFFKKNKIHVLTIGFGNENGSKIFLGKNKNGESIFKKYDGEEVLSKLNKKFLENLSKDTGGKYFSEYDNFEKIFTFIQKNFEKKIILEKEIQEKKYFQLFAFLAFLLIIIEIYLERIFKILKKNKKNIFK
ncbi:VWA domain-containing protein [Candidatus Gracilibacteria bacterium]|nr:VWA domain-containing protein [Candidatus Gracilibacteria bacterium]